MVCMISVIRLSRHQTYHVESQDGIDLDRSVDIAEQNRHRQEEDIDRIPHIMAEEFNELADKHPQTQRPQGLALRLDVPVGSGLVQEQDEEQIAKQRRRRQRGEVDRIRTPRLTAKRLSVSFSSSEGFALG